MDIRTDEIRSVAFPTLTNDQMAFLKRYGEGRKMQAKQLLFVKAIAPISGEARTIAVHGARRSQSVSLRWVSRSSRKKRP
jgi:hypothetical protein